EIIQSRHHATRTVGEAAKAFSQEYKEIALGTQRKLRGLLSQWVIGEDLNESTGEWEKRNDADLARPFCGLEIHTVEKRDVRMHLRKVRATVNRLGHHNRDRKSTRLNSSHVAISYAVFCLKKKKKVTG